MRKLTQQSPTNFGEPKDIENVVPSTLALHNVLINSSTHNIYYSPGLVDTENTDCKVMRALGRNDTSIDSMYPLEVPDSVHNASVSVS